MTKDYIDLLSEDQQQQQQLNKKQKGKTKQKKKMEKNQTKGVAKKTKKIYPTLDSDSDSDSDLDSDLSSDSGKPNASWLTGDIDIRIVRVRYFYKNKHIYNEYNYLYKSSISNIIDIMSKYVSLGKQTNGKLINLKRQDIKNIKYLRTLTPNDIKSGNFNEDLEVTINQLINIGPMIVSANFYRDINDTDKFYHNLSINKEESSKNLKNKIIIMSNENSDDDDDDDYESKNNVYMYVPQSLFGHNENFEYDENLEKLKNRPKPNANDASGKEILEYYMKDINVGKFISFLEYDKKDRRAYEKQKDPFSIMKSFQNQFNFNHGQNKARASKTKK